MGDLQVYQPIRQWDVQVQKWEWRRKLEVSRGESCQMHFWRECRAVPMWTQDHHLCLRSRYYIIFYGFYGNIWEHKNTKISSFYHFVWESLKQHFCLDVHEKLKKNSFTDILGKFLFKLKVSVVYQVTKEKAKLLDSKANLKTSRIFWKISTQFNKLVPLRRSSQKF